MSTFQAKIGEASLIIHAIDIREAIDLAEKYDRDHHGDGLPVHAVKQIKDRVINVPPVVVEAQPKLWSRKEE